MLVNSYLLHTAALVLFYQRAKIFLSDSLNGLTIATTISIIPIREKAMHGYNDQTSLFCKPKFTFTSNSTIMLKIPSAIEAPPKM